MKRGTVGYRPTWTDPYRFVAAYDLHIGWEVSEGKKRPVHSKPAINVMMQFTTDYKPHLFLLGGDALDLASISHHNQLKRLSVENLRLEEDLKELNELVMTPVEELGTVDTVYLAGNHERFVQDLTDAQPGLADTLTIPKLLNLEERGWQWVPVGGHYDLGKLRFIHGDQIGGGEHVAKAAVMQHHKSIALGHHHSHQEYTAHSPVDSKDIHIGIEVPCLANRAPAYAWNKPNRWAHGFLHGAVWPDGTFSHTVSHIVNERAYINGKVYSAR